MATAYLGLGANLGDRTQSLVAACAALHQHPGITVKAVSSLYHTAPVGFTDQGWFLNAVLCAHTTLSPTALLQVDAGHGAPSGPNADISLGTAGAGY